MKRSSGKTYPTFYQASRLACLVAFFVSLSPTFAARDSDTLTTNMQSVEVRASRFTSSLRLPTNGSFIWDLSSMGDLPQVLGSADPVRYAQLLPGVQTNGECRSGIHIQGCDNGHNFISIGGVPIYNVNHLLGIFSTFNALHYPSMSLSLMPTAIGTANRLGGELTMELPTAKEDSLSGQVSIGMIASQGTIRFPIGKKTSMELSLRGSYLNLLYSHWLKADDSPFRYSFYDTNATLTHQINKHHMLLVDFYHGMDNGSFNESSYLANMKTRWGNTMGALHWLYDNDNGLSMKNSLYVTSYVNRFQLTMQEEQYQLPSSITDLGYRGKAHWGRWQVGLEAILHRIRPQAPEHSNANSISSERTVITQSFEGVLHTSYEQPISSNFSVTAGVKNTLYNINRHTFFSADPSLSFSAEVFPLRLTASYALRHQYLFQTGFSDMGLPTEFWMSCNDSNHPQYAHLLSLNAALPLWHNRLRLSANIFYKKLYNQIEYRGTVLDFINSIYDLQSNLLHGQGENYGFGLMFSKVTGSLTGWVGYTFTRARRTFPRTDLSGSYPANHERPHELNALLSYSINSHWNIAGTFVFASGTPFTPPVNLSLINGNIITQYGEHNASRLRPYCRLDLSVNYKWLNRKRHENGFNLSLYNATCRKNHLFYYVVVHEDKTLSYRPVSLFSLIMPSISYSFKL